MRWRNREQTVKYKFCIIWNRSCAGEFEIPWSTLQTFSVHPDSCPFLSVFCPAGSGVSLLSWSQSSLLSLVWKPFSVVQFDFILKKRWQKWENCSGKSRNPPPSPFTATYFSGWSWASLCFRPPSQVGSLRPLEDSWSSVSGSGYFLLEPLQASF